MEVWVGESPNHMIQYGPGWSCVCVTGLVNVPAPLTTNEPVCTISDPGVPALSEYTARVTLSAAAVEIRLREVISVLEVTVTGNPCNHPGLNAIELLNNTG